MGKGAPLRWWENRQMGRHLRGRGLEVGALWKRFPVPATVERVWYADRLDVEGLAEHFTGHVKGVLPIDLVADATRLPVAPRSLDFLIACNILEHLPFPLAALRHWHEALAPGGALLVRVPDKRYTFDHRRPRTPLAHLIEEYEHPGRFDRRAHYADFVEHVHGRAPGDPRLLSWLHVALVEVIVTDYAEERLGSPAAKADYAVNLFLSGAGKKSA